MGERGYRKGSSRRKGVLKMTNPVIPMPQKEEQRAPGQVFLQPIAAPSILGLYGFGGATFIVAANMAHWFGSSQSALYLAPFAAMFGGLAQFLAGMWSFKARDAVATAMHGMWGSFWLAYGLLNILFATGALTKPTGAFQALGFWFIVLAVITWAGTYAAAAEVKAIAWVLGWLAAGSTAAAVGQLTGAEWVNILAGWLFIVSALIAIYAASALMLAAAYGRPVLPMGKTARIKELPDIMIGAGEPGVIRGQ